ncbi:RuvC family protein [Alteromonas macleodii]|uniref:hypothetical protein n=1 Tax=Alteromonas macleodii TaxID=28108 RepID=UPI00313F33FD
MNTLGIRVEPKKTTFVVIEAVQEIYQVVNNEVIKVPAALDFPEKLKYIRNCVLDILREYSISVAGIRVTEGNSQNMDITRLQIEGVIQEAFSSSDVQHYFSGRKTSISSRLKINTDDFDEIIKGRKEFKQVGNWELLRNSPSREATLAAMGALY